MRSNRLGLVSRVLASCALALIASTPLLPATASAQSLPNKTIRLVSGVSPGSASDTLARIIAEKLQASLGQPVIVENKLGVGGLIGAQYVAKSEPDGTTIMIYTSAFTVAPLLTPGPLKPDDLAPVATMAVLPTVLVTSPSKGYRTLADLVAAAKARPGQLVASSAGIGSSTHMNLERFLISAGINVLHVPLKGSPEAMTEVITGRSDMYFAPVFAVGTYIKEGRLVPLGIGSAKRSALMPDVPTTIEAGYPDSDYNFWIGALVAAKTPRPIIERLNREINAAINSPDVQEKIHKLGADPLTMPLPEFEAMIKREFESNARLIKAANIKAN